MIDVTISNTPPILYNDANQHAATTTIAIATTAATYLTQNASEMKSSEGDEADSYSLYDECFDQDDKRVKEYNNEVSFQIELENEK